MKFDELAVQTAIAMISSLPDYRLLDAPFLEHELIPSLGLNDEALSEQPSELSSYFGTGLHLWQYPNQLSSYLIWLTANACDISSYVEIGCRWGGTFILISEWLRRIGAPLQTAIAIDPIPPSRFVEQYQAIRPKVRYLCEVSSSPAVAQALSAIPPGLIFIDGDHNLRGAFFDHLLARQHARILVHHDISSDACPDTSFLWKALKELETGFEFSEFIEQYPSVQGSFLGIGAMKRKN